MCGSEHLGIIMTSTKYNSNEDPSLPRTKYLKHTLYLTLEELYKGTIRKLAVNKNVVCGECHGSGSASEVAEDYDTCEECSGLGVQTMIRSSHPDMEERIERDCELCWGKGEAVIVEDRCHNCSGRKTVPEQSILIVRVKRGSRHGQKIIYKGEGTQEPEMRPGDVVVILEAIDHPIFKRQGNDLHMTMHLDLVESLCGFKKLITTLDRRQLWISSPRGKVIQSNDLKYLPGEGMPKYTNPNEKGKLIIQFEVNLPSSIGSYHVPSLEKCLPPRQKVDIPPNAIECNLMNMASADEYQEQNQAQYEPNDDEYTQDQDYEPHYESHDQYDHDDGMHDYGLDEQYDQQNHGYQDDGYDVQGNYEHPSEYDHHDTHNQQGYDFHNFHQEQYYEQEEDSLESYDATKQYRFRE